MLQETLRKLNKMEEKKEETKVIAAFNNHLWGPSRCIYRNMIDEIRRLKNERSNLSSNINFQHRGRSTRKRDRKIACYKCQKDGHFARFCTR